VRLGISAIALIVGAIAVANTMMMSVFERTREFGVLRAIGAKPRFLFRLVLLEAILLSVVGAIAGVILGRLGMIVVNDIANDLIGLEVAALTLRLVIFAVIVALLMGLLSGLIPAFRASRIPIAIAMARE
jgi:putative ABC transport system permease protein